MTDFATSLRNAQRRYDLDLPEDTRTDAEIEADLARRLKQERHAAAVRAAELRMLARTACNPVRPLKI